MIKTIPLFFILFITNAVWGDTIATNQLNGSSSFFNVRDYGAKGDGEMIDSPAINAAIEAASESGGGTVVFPSGVYASYTIRLKSHITLLLEAGSTLLAAYPSVNQDEGYYKIEPNPWGDEKKYQDFGHSHWRNSLIWGDGLSDISIVGPGLIDGRALGGAHPVTLPGEPVVVRDESKKWWAYQPGTADKAIALRNCRNVTLRDFSMFRCGHFALLATGVNNLHLSRLKVDSNRDGFDIDACSNVNISDCMVNTPHDDAIVLKSSYALGEIRPTENVVISGCQVSGFGIGTLLDGTLDRSFDKAPDRGGPTGRIKIGTESNGSFRNISISNCVFDRCRGLALEMVDGGSIEDVVISNLVMRNIVNSPIFIRLGNRARGPEGTSVGSIQRIKISDVVASKVDARFPAQIMGLPNHPVKDVSLQNIMVQYRGGIRMEDVKNQPESMVNPFFTRGDEPGLRGPREPFAVPLQEAGYPEPSMFGILPASGFYGRYIDGLTMTDIHFASIEPDERPVVTLDSVQQVFFEDFRAPFPDFSPLFELRNVEQVELEDVRGLKDQIIESTNQLSLR